MHHHAMSHPQATGTCPNGRMPAGHGQLAHTTEPDQNPGPDIPDASLQPHDFGIGHLFYSLREALIVADAATGQIVLWSPGAETLFGYSAAEALTLTVDVLVPERFKQLHAAGIARYHATGHGSLVGSGTAVPLTAMRKDGDEVAIELTLTPIQAQLGEGRFVLALARDVTERTQAAELLAKIIETMADGMLVFDADGQVTLANAAAARIFGLKRDQIVATSYAQPPWRRLTVDGKPFADEEAPFALVKQTGQPVHGVEFAIERPNGERSVLSINAAPLYDAANVFVGVVALVTDITERKRLEEQLTQQAFYDSLTRLPNRKLFLDRLRHSLTVVRRRGATVAVLFLDLDRFKPVNDSFGHAAGDTLLAAVGERLLTCVRSSDTVARFGGDEFTILLEDISHSSDTTRVAERIIAAVRKPFKIDNQRMKVGASIGIALCTPANVDAGAEDLLRQADIALYQAKAAGKGRAVIFEPRMNPQSLEPIEAAAAD